MSGWWEWFTLKVPAELELVSDHGEGEGKAEIRKVTSQVPPSTCSAKCHHWNRAEHHLEPCHHVSRDHQSCVRGCAAAPGANT